MELKDNEFVQPVKLREYSPRITKESDAELLGFIWQGGEVYKKGDYAGAVRHFNNKDAAIRAGYHLGYDMGRQGGDILPENVEAEANIMATHSHFRGDRMLIYPSLVLLPEGQQPGAKPYPVSFYREAALVYMEEWIHALQHKLGRPVAGYADNEVDVAAYMLKMGMKPTNTFMRRYDRGLILSAEESGDDSLDKVPAIRRGTFVQVMSSRGIENTWQITGFEPATGNATIQNFYRNETTIVARADFDKLLPEATISPFAKVEDMAGLLTILRGIKGIYGFEKFYSYGDLERLIDQVRRGGQLETLPRSGGLRIKVHELAVKAGWIRPGEAPSIKIKTQR